MATATVQYYDPNYRPIKSVTLVLSGEEASALCAVTGAIAGQSKGRTVTSNVYYELEKIAGVEPDNFEVSGTLSLSP